MSDRPSKYFSWNEATTRKGVPGADLQRLTPSAREALKRVCANADVIREHVGEPVWITSGFRFGDSKQHGAGQALDMQVRSLTPRQLIRVVYDLDKAGKFPHSVRQAGAESRSTGLDGKMAEHSNRWTHLAVFGIGDEPWRDRSRLPWFESPDGESYIVWRP